MARPKKTDNSNTKDVIFEKAVDLFIKYGYGGASIRDLTKACGIKESTFYHYFDSKEHLLNCIYDTMDEFLEKSKPTEAEINNIIKTVAPIDFFTEFFLSFRNNHNQLTNKIAIFIMKEDFRNERAKEYVLKKNGTDMVDFHVNILRGYKDMGQIDKQCDCKAIALELHCYYIGMLNEWTHLCYEGVDDSHLQKQLTFHVKKVLEKYC